MLHHTLGDGRYDAYYRAAEQVTCAQASLFHASNAAFEIDRILHECIVKARPVYLMLPTDIAYAKISSARLSTPVSTTPLPNEPETETDVINQLVSIIQEAGDTAIALVDACAIRHGCTGEVSDFLRKTGMRVYSAPMGKCAIDCDYPNYGGVYVGAISHPANKEAVENAGLVISLGALKSDFNTGNFTYKIPGSHIVELHSDHTKIKYAYYPNVGMKEMLPKLTERLPAAPMREIPLLHTVIMPEDDHVEEITQKWMWPRICSYLRGKDIVVAETGTSSYGVLDIPFPCGTKFISQILYGSIGYSLGATLGAAFAARDLDLGRTILFIGDGSLQLTVQELATMIRHDLKPTIFVLNNDGYTIEKYLHGWERKYNSISRWNFTGLLSVLGDFEGRTKSYTVRTKKEMSDLLDDPEFASGQKMQLVEIILGQHDAPEALRKQAALSQKANKYVS